MLDTHAQYLLDCACELGELSPMEYAVLAYDTASQSALTQSAETLVGHDATANFARDRLNALSETQQNVLALSVISSGTLPSLWRAYQERVAFLIELKIGEDLGWRNQSPVHIWGDRGDKLFNSELDICEPRVTKFLQRECTSVLARWDADIHLFRKAKDWGARNPSALHRELTRRLAEQSQALNTKTVLTLNQAKHNGQRVRDKEMFLKSLRAEQARAKRAVKKAFKLFEKRGKSDTVGMLVSGGEVVITHPSSEFKFVVKPHSAGWLLNKTTNPGGTTPFTLELHTKEDLYLARLCVFFQDTPVLDQLMALSLFIESGDEAELLHQANWFSMEKQGISWIEANKPEYQTKVARPADAVDLYAQARANFEPYAGISKQWSLQYLENRFAFEALPASIEQLMLDYRNETTKCFEKARRLRISSEVGHLDGLLVSSDVELV